MVLTSCDEVMSSNVLGRITLPVDNRPRPLSSSTNERHCSFCRIFTAKCILLRKCSAIHHVFAVSNGPRAAQAVKFKNEWKKVEAPLFIQFLDASPQSTIETTEAGEAENSDWNRWSDSDISEKTCLSHEDDGLQHRGDQGLELSEKVAVQQEHLPSHEVVSGSSQDGGDPLNDDMDHVENLWGEFEFDMDQAVDLKLDFLEEMFPTHRGLLTGRKVFSVGRQGSKSVLERLEFADEEEVEDDRSDAEGEDNIGDNPQVTVGAHGADKFVPQFYADGDVGNSGWVTTLEEDVEANAASAYTLPADEHIKDGGERHGNWIGSDGETREQNFAQPMIPAVPDGEGGLAEDEAGGDVAEPEDSVSNGDAGISGASDPAYVSISERLRLLGSPSSTTRPPQSDVHQLVGELVRGGRDVTNSVYDVMESYSEVLSTFDGNLAIEALGQKRHFRQAFAVFEWMRSHDPSMVNARSYSLIFPLLGRAGMLGKARLLFQNMRDERQFHCIQVYNSYIGVLLTCGRHEEVDSVLEEMKDRGINEDAVTYSLYINSAMREKRGLKEVLRLYDAMLDNGVAVNTAVFGAVVNAFCMEGRLDDALVFVKEMETSGMPPNTLVFNTLINAFGKAGKLDVAEWLLSDMKKRKLRLHLSTYNILLNVYGKQGQLEVVEELFTEMQDAGLKPDVVTFTTLINSYAKRKMSEKAAASFAKMRKAGIVPNAHSYTALIHAYSEDGWHTKAAMTFDSMKREGITPTAQTYTALLEGYRRAGAVEDVSRVWSEMKREGCQGTRITFNTLLDAFAKQGRYKEARDVVSEYAFRGFKPDRLTYNMLINAYGRGGNHEKIPDLVTEMKKIGLKPDSYTYCCIVYAFLRMRDFTNVFRWFDKMVQVGQKPDPQTFAKLAALVQEKRQDKEAMVKRSILGQEQRQAKQDEKVVRRYGGKNEFWKKKPKKCGQIRLKHKPKAS